jgi:hypothetical protein
LGVACTPQIPKKRGLLFDFRKALNLVHSWLHAAEAGGR